MNSAARIARELGAGTRVVSSKTDFGFTKIIIKTPIKGKSHSVYLTQEARTTEECIAGLLRQKRKMERPTETTRDCEEAGVLELQLLDAFYLWTLAGCCFSLATEQRSDGFYRSVVTVDRPGKRTLTFSATRRQPYHSAQAAAYASRARIPGSAQARDNPERRRSFFLLHTGSFAHLALLQD